MLRGGERMSPKFLVLSLILLSVLFAFPSTSKGYSSQSLGPGPATFVIATIAGGPQTVDPAMAYDTASGELVANVYDALIAFKGTRTSEFVPWLAESYSVSPDGFTYQFKIRPNVPWQNTSYGFVTPTDAEYSFERMLVRDYTGGPAWMFWYPIFGVFKAGDFGSLSDPAAATMVGNKIDSAVTSNATHLTIQFQTGNAYLAFSGILAQTWGSVLSKQWCIDHGDWNPAVDRLSDGTWVNAHDPPEAPPRWSPSPLDNPARMMGSGPFKLDYLNWGASWSIARNTAFWGGWGTNRVSLLGVDAPSLGYLDRITEYFIADYAIRLAGFTGTNPIYDSIAVPRSQISTLWQQSGIRCTYPLPTPMVDGLFFSYNVSMRSPYIGSPTNATYFGQNGIRPDFFSDVHARRAVAYSFNWSQFITSAYLGEAQQPILPIPVWDAFYNSSLTGYRYNPAKAIEEWKLAWGGQVWANGFRFTIVYNNIPRQTVANMLKTSLEAQNPKFHVDVVEPPCGNYGAVWHGGPGGRATGPIYIVGWLHDYPDADDWVTPFIESSGTFAYPQHIDMDPYSSLMDDLIDWGRHNTTNEGRSYNYQRLWQLYIQQVPSVPLEEAVGRRFERDWVQGWYFNPAYPGVYGYTMWKQDLPPEDVDSDGKVDIRDLATAAKAFGAYYIQPLLPPNPSGPAGYYSINWNSKADVNIVNPSTGARSDMKIDIKDLATIVKLYGFIGDPWTPGS